MSFTAGTRVQVKNNGLGSDFRTEAERVGDFAGTVVDTGDHDFKGWKIPQVTVEADNGDRRTILVGDLEEAPELPQLWVETNVLKTARECTPGTVVWLSVGDTHGVGWKVVTVKSWTGHGNGYASLRSEGGSHCGQFLATDLLEVQPA